MDPSSREPLRELEEGVAGQRRDSGTPPSPSAAVAAPPASSSSLAAAAAAAAAEGLRLAVGGSRGEEEAEGCVLGGTAAAPAATAGGAAGPSDAALDEDDAQAPPAPRSACLKFARRCLLLPSCGVLVVMLPCLYIAQAGVDGTLRDNWRALRTFVKADVFNVIACIGYLSTSAINMAWLAVRVRRCYPCEGRAALGAFLCTATFAFVLLLGVWHQLVSIGASHDLEYTCTIAGRCKNLDTTLSGHFVDFCYVWEWFIAPQWVPTGVFQDMLSCVIGPVRLVMWAFNPGAAPDEFGRWREVAVGTILWACSAHYGTMLWRREMFDANAGFAERALRHVVMLAMVAIPVYIAFLLTAEPFVRFYRFLLNPWLSLAGALMQRQRVPFRAFEVVAAVLMVWADFRSCYIFAHTRRQLAQAYRRMETAFRTAIERPFVARLDTEFGQHVPRNSFELSRNSSIGHTRSFRTRWSNVKEKQEVLLAVRQVTVREELGDVGLPRVFWLGVKRETIVEQSCEALFTATAAQLLIAQVHISFEDEPGIDQGGLTRDWFDAFAKALADGAEDSAGSSLFIAGADQTLMPRPVPRGGDQEALLKRFFSVGKFLAFAVLRKQPLPLSFNLVACKHLLRVPVSLEDVRRLDPDFYRQRVKRVLEDGGLEYLAAALGEPLTFVSAPTPLKPSPVELCDGGATRVVTDENKVEYVRLLCEEFLAGAFRQEMSCILRGFWEVLPLSTMRENEVTPRELSMMISGVADVDPEEWKEHTEVGGDGGGESTDSTADGSTAARAEVRTWFWELLQDFNAEQRCKLLHFSTGSSRLPPGGFADLHPKFSLEVTPSGSPDHLPHAHTCANKLVLHGYASKEQLKEKLLQAIDEEGFGFA